MSNPLAGIAPPPPAPPAPPTPEDGARVAAQTQQPQWVRTDIEPPQPIARQQRPTARLVQPQAQVPPPVTDQQAAQPAAPAVQAGPRKRPNAYAAVVGAVLAGGVAWALLHRSHSQQSTLQANVAALTSQVSALQAQPSGPATTIAVNPMSAMPCAVTTDARRFIGIDSTGALSLGPSVAIARQAYDLYRTGVDYRAMRIGTGVSITQLEVFPGGAQGVPLFDCGTPAGAATPAPTTTTKRGE